MESHLGQTCPQVNHEAPLPNFSTFQPMGLTQGSYQPSTRRAPSTQALKVQEAQSTTGIAHSRTPVLEAARVLGTAANSEEVPGEEDLSLQAETRAWVRKTQAHWLLHRAAPAWFHGFITRREAERLLQPQPQGCYLVRFSESAVTFVLSYRSWTCCRHFLLAQLGDGRYVVLGEDSAHMHLQDLLRHYTACPLSPYGETLTQPLARQTSEPVGLSLRTQKSESGSKKQDPDTQRNPLIKQGQDQAPIHTEKEGAQELMEPSQPRRPKPPIPAKPQPFPEVCRTPASQGRRASAANPIYHEPDEPIVFYAMGRGSPGEAPSNIYAEVESSSGKASARHTVLQKSWSRPTSGSQEPGGLQQRSENSVVNRGPPLPEQPSPPWRHTLPHNLSRQAWLPLEPPQ